MIPRGSDGKLYKIKDILKYKQIKKKDNWLAHSIGVQLITKL